MFRELCGEKTLKNVVLVTNMWGKVTPQQGADREQQLKDKYFKAAIEKDAQLRRHSNTPESAREIVRKILDNRPLALKIQHELIDQRKDIGETGAGKELKREICLAVVEYGRGIAEVEESMQKAIEEEDEQSREELEEEKRKMQEEMEKLRKDLEDMESRFEKARREMEERIKARFEAREKRTQEAYEAKIRKYQEKVDELEREGRESTSEIASLKKKMAEARQKASQSTQGATKIKKWRCILM